MLGNKTNLALGKPVAQAKASNKSNEKNNCKCHVIIIFVKASILAKKLASVAIVDHIGRRLQNTNSVGIY
jgi:hypothetical protein